MFSSNTTQVSDGGYQISRSLRFNSADSAYLNRTPASAGNQKTWTWSGWVKRSTLGVDYATLFGVTNAGNDSSWNALIFYSDGLGFQTWNNVYRRTTQVLRDTSAWYHVVLAVDTTQATASDRIKLYLNGSQITAFSTSSDPSQNTDLPINNSVAHTIGRDTQQSINFGGYMTEINFIDGQALTPSSFGETNADTGVWQPKAYSGSYGTNGFYLNFSDNSNTTAATLGKDYSGNGNNWTPNNFSVTSGIGNDSMVDTPTPYGIDTGVGGEVRGNYCTINPLDGVNSATITNGNLNIANGGTATFRGTIAAPASSGKWYWEFTQATTVNSGNPVAYGMASVQGSPSHSAPQRAAYYQTDGSYKTLVIYNNGAYVNSQNVVTTIGINDTLQFAYDSDTGKVWVGKSGAWADSSGGTTGNPATGANPTFTMAGVDQPMTPTFDHAGVAYTASLNCGQQPFVNTAPSGYKALCTQNLPTPTIGATTATQATQYFTPALYTGTNATQSVTTGFQPDLVWIKSRSAVSRNTLFDAVRGVTKVLWSDSTDAEGTANAGTGLTSLNSTGFTLGTEIAGTSGSTNVSGVTYASWNWKASGTTVSNTSGSITSTVSANTTSGFSVVTYTNASSGTVGHGLGVAPAMVIYKDRTNNGVNWIVLHQSLTNMSNYFLVLNATNAVATGTALGGNPTSSVIYTNTNIIQNSAASVAYCFAEVAGYSKFGSYTGNFDTNGPFVFTGFRPAYVLIKATSISSNNWFIYDSTRSTYNLTQQPLLANASDAELNSSNFGIDLLSNGFKIRAIDSNINTNNATYIYMALASNPFKYSLAR